VIGNRLKLIAVIHLAVNVMIAIPKPVDIWHLLCYSFHDSGIEHTIFSTLVIIFVHYVARSFCGTIKLPKEMPKMPNPPEAGYRFY
jgi:hypothetical protein